MYCGSTVMLGKTLSHYKILEEVGQGGMGTVYRARDLKLKREVAIKVLREDLVADPERKDRFVQEALSAAALEHPHVAMVHEIDEVDGVTFIAMEFVHGPVLRVALHEERFSVGRTLDLSIEMAEGLSSAHDHGIVHRDFKPGNVMITEDGHAKIIDFGLAKLVKHLGPLSEEETYVRPQTQSGRILGTVAYMSPEQARGEHLDGRSDIFSFGIVLYEMLSGELPFRGPSAADMQSAILKEEPAPLPALELDSAEANGLQQIVVTCLAKEPSERYSTMRDLVADLQSLRRRVDSRSLEKRRPTPRPAPPEWLWKLAAPALAVALLAVVFWNWAARAPDAVAVLPLSYAGPSENGPLSQLLPLAVSDRLKGTTSLRVVSFAVSQAYEPGEAPGDVAREMGVDWVVSGEVRVDGARLSMSILLSGREGAREGWPKEIRGNVVDAVAIADGLATSIGVDLEADRSGESTLNRDPEAFEQYLQGKMFLEGWDVDRNFEKAEAAFERALEIDEGFAEAYAGLARAMWTRHRETGEIDLVRRALTHALRSASLAPSLPEAHVAVGTVQLGRGRSAEALISFQTAQELAPEDDAVCRLAADAFAELGRHDEAELLYQRAIDLRPRHWESHNAKGGFHVDSGEFEKAEASFREVIRLRPESDIGYTNLAATHLIAGEIDEAEPLLEAAISFNPASDKAHNNLGFVYFAQGRFGEAAEAFRNAIAVGAEDPVHYGGLGDTLRQLDETEQAHLAYTKAVELWTAQLDVDPTDEFTRAALSTGLAGLSRCDEALSQAELAGAESVPYVSYTLAKTYAMCGDEDATLRHVRMAIREGALVDVRTNPDLAPLLEHPSVRPLLR